MSAWRLSDTFNNDPEVGHLWAEDMIWAIGKGFVPTGFGFTIDVHNYVWDCQVCALYKCGPNPEPDQQQMLEHSHPLPMGPYPITRASNQYIVILTDMWKQKQCRRWTLPLLSATWRKIYSLVGAIQRYHGLQVELMCNKLHIQPWTTTSYHPRANLNKWRNDKIKKVLWGPWWLGQMLANSHVRTL